MIDLRDALIVVLSALEDAGRYRWLKARMVGVKWSDIQNLFPNGAPEEEKYVTADGPKKAIDAEREP